MKSYDYAHRQGVKAISLVIFPWNQQVLVEGQWQPHPEIVAALAAQQKDSV